MKTKLTTILAFTCSLISSSVVQAQAVGDPVTIIFQANNTTGFDTFTNNREYNVLDSSFSLDMGGVNYTAANVLNFSVTDSTPGTGFPHNDSFQSSGGLWTLTDPNHTFNTAGAGESLTLEFNLSGDSATNNIISSNILSNLIAQSYTNSDFQEDPSFPIDDPFIKISYSPPFQSPQDLMIGFSAISFANGSDSDHVEITINGSVISNNITGGTSAAAVPEPSSVLLLVSSLIITVTRRRR